MYRYIDTNISVILCPLIETTYPIQEIFMGSRNSRSR